MYACGLSSRPPSAAPLLDRRAVGQRAQRVRDAGDAAPALRLLRDGARRRRLPRRLRAVAPWWSAPHARPAVRSAAPRAPSWSAEGGGAIATIAGERVAGPRKSGENATASETRLDIIKTMAALLALHLVRGQAAAEPRCAEPLAQNALASASASRRHIGACIATVAYRVRTVTMAYYDKMAAMALKQDQRIAELEAENAALKVKVDTLQAELAEFKAPHVNGKPKETTIREEVSDEMSHTPHAMSSAI